MAKTKFNNVKISGLTTVVANNRKSIDGEVNLYGGDLKQIERVKKTIGLNERCVVDNETTSLDLCAQAFQKLIIGMNLAPEDVDGLIFVTQTPDYFLPSNSSVIHGKFALSKNCACLDLNQGCSGYVYGLWMAHMMVSSGTCNKVVLLAGDSMSRAVNPRDRASFPLFGDSGTATLIERAQESTTTFFDLHTDGRGFESIIIPAGGFRKPCSDETKVEFEEDGNFRSEENLAMHGGKVFNFAMKEVPKAVDDILSFSGKTTEEIDYIVFHQANKFVIENITKRLKKHDLTNVVIPSDTVGKFGNQGPSSIPTTLSDALPVIISNSKKQLLLCGFGVGLSWASVILELDRIYCPKVYFYKKEN